MYKVFKAYLAERSDFLISHNITIIEELPINSNDRQIGITVQFKVEDKSIGSFSVRTLDTGYRLYDLEVMNLELAEATLVESDIFSNELELTDKIELFFTELLK